MDIDTSNYDIEGIKDYFKEMKREQEQYYGTAMTLGMDFAMVDLINVTSEFGIEGKSDTEIVLMAKAIGIDKKYYLGKKY